MKLLDWLFSINRGNAPLVQEQLPSEKPIYGGVVYLEESQAIRYPMGFKCVARLTPIAHGLGGLRLDWAMCELTPKNCNRMHSYWRNQQFKSRDGRNTTIKPARSYADGFKAVELGELMELVNKYTNSRECSLFEGKPTL